MEKESASVTFLVPAFNVESYLEFCLESIFSQTHKNFKAIIINDASTDSTAKILKKIKDKRIMTIHQKKNRGYIFCLNLGLSLITTKYTARLDADDISFPERLEKQLRFLEENPRVSVVGSRMGYISGDKKAFRLKVLGKEFLPSFCPKMQKPPFWDPATDGETIPHSSATFLTQKIRKTGGYRNLFPAEDLDLWYRLAARGAKFACLPDILTLYRINPQGATSSALLRQALVTEYVEKSLRFRICKKAVPSFRKFSKHFSLSPAAQKNLSFKKDLRKAMGLFLNNQRLFGIYTLFQIIARNPFLLIKKTLSRF